MSNCSAKQEEHEIFFQNFVMLSLCIVLTWWNVMWHWKWTSYSRITIILKPEIIALNRALDKSHTFHFLLNKFENSILDIRGSQEKIIHLIFSYHINYRFYPNSDTNSDQRSIRYQRLSFSSIFIAKRNRIASTSIHMLICMDRVQWIGIEIHQNTWSTTRR